MAETAAMAADDADSGDSDDAEKDAEEPGGEAIRDAVSKGEARSLSDILAKVSRTYPGEVVRIRLKGKDEDLQYRIRILQRNGERIEIRVNARTGRIIEAD